MTENGLGETVGLLDEIGRLGLSWAEAVVRSVSGKEVDDASEERDPSVRESSKAQSATGRPSGLAGVRLLSETLQEGEARVCRAGTASWRTGCGAARWVAGWVEAESVG